MSERNSLNWMALLCALLLTAGVFTVISCGDDDDDDDDDQVADESACLAPCNTTALEAIDSCLQQGANCYAECLDDADCWDVCSDTYGDCYSAPFEQLAGCAGNCGTCFQKHWDCWGACGDQYADDEAGFEICEETCHQSYRNCTSGWDWECLNACADPWDCYEDNCEGLETDGEESACDYQCLSENVQCQLACY